MSSQMNTIWVGVLLLAAAAGAGAHCQIPCGIYGDDTRFTLMREHVATIEKSAKEIERIGKGGTPDNNQLVRWVMNKENHADELAEIVTYYFMAQRVTPAPEEDKAGRAKYIEKITLLHEILIAAMKVKQTADVETCARLRALIDRFEKAYTGK